jgi:hypothetical protein
MAKSKAPAQAPPTVKEVLDRFVIKLRQHLDGQLDTLAADLYKALEDPDGTGRVDAKRAVAQIAKATAKPEAAEVRADQVPRLLSAVKMLDEANTLRGLLDGLGRGAAMEATRVAILLVDGDMLRPYADFGFAVGPRPTDVALDGAPSVARSLHERQRVSLSTARSADVPAFMRKPAGAAGIVVPVVVGGDAVALVYAEGPERDGEPASWSEHVEVLSRHASARLEAITSKRTVEVFNTNA